MNNTKNIIRGDRVLWVALALLSIFSFLPVFSASSNLTYVLGQGTPWSHLLKHFIVLLFGFGLIYVLNKIPYQYFKGISILALPLTIFLLIYTATQGNLIAGANANRWINIPIVGLSFQTSTLATIVLLAYVANIMSKENPKLYRLKTSILPLWFPVFLVILLIIIGSLGISALMLGAVGMHIKMKSTFRSYIASVAMIFICIFILYNIV